MALELYSPMLSDALVILGAAGLVIPVFARFRITPIIGFIVVGLLVGPFGLGSLVGEAPWLRFITITDSEGLAPFAEFGIILLLFSIGLELSFNRLWDMRRQVFGLGAMELIVCGVALTAMLVSIGGETTSGALALGLALSLSSTALVLRITDTKTPVGRGALAMLLFEDIALVPIIFLLGALAPAAAGGEGFGGLFHTLWLGLLVIVALLLFGRFMLPGLFAQAARTKSPEVFLAASLLVVIVAALATAGAGLSPIVGALIAGLLIAETEYQGEVEAIIAPFQGLALGIFLITIGMSIDLPAVWAGLGPILLATAGVLALKALVTALLLRLIGASPGTAAETGILMASPSETTLIVLAAALSAQLIAPASAAFWQTVTALGMMVTPLLALIGRRLGQRVDVNAVVQVPLDVPERHAIVVGFGRVGQLVADMLIAHDQPYVAVDSDTDSVSIGARRGYKVVFGDASHEHALSRLGADAATAVILTMDEPVAAQRLVRKLRQQYPELPIIARARDAHHAAQLYRAGASHAVPETLESSLQLSEAVLVDLGVAMGPVIASIHEKRDELRAQIMEEGDLAHKPKLKSASLSERTA